MRVGILHSNSEIQNNIINIFSKYYPKVKVSIITNEKDLISYQIIFLEISYNKENEIRYYNSIKTHRPIVIGIVDQIYLLKVAFRYSIFWCLEVAYLDEDMKEMFPYLNKEILRKYPIVQFKKGKTYFKINVKKIRYLYKDRNNLWIITNDKEYMITESLKNLMCHILLFDILFFRINSGIAVNKNSDFLFDGENIVYDTNIRLPVSRKYRKEISEYCKLKK